ncbi:MAG: hypothetical protein HKN23_16680 [Verrucomicrobiales bacterium]|nr:hypothetical protein [Verrucomicrobiales bacterium]
MKWFPKRSASCGPFFILLALGSSLSGQDASPILEESFDSEEAISGESWRPFSGGKPNISIENGQLAGRRSPAGGLVALSRDFAKPQDRIEIEFSFAYRPAEDGKGRTLHLWTHEPGGKDASQFNFCIQNGNRLMQFDGRTRTWEILTDKIQPTTDPEKPVRHRLRAVVDSDAGGIDFWISEPGQTDLPDEPTGTLAAYRTNLPIGGVSFVSGTRLAEGATYWIDDLVIRGGRDAISAPSNPPALPEPFELWTGPKIPSDPDQIPFAEGIEHRVIHRPGESDYKFLHGAAILEHDGIFYANWANSPVHENGPHETLRGRRSTDGGKTWGPLEIVGPGFDGADRHSHGVLFVHEDQVWTICARFGIGKSGKRFPGLKGEAFVLNPQSNQWESRGIVMENCWPYDEPVRMGNGNYITGGQDKDGLPVIAISHGTDFTKWDSILIPYHPKLAPSFAETTVWAEDNRVLATIRGGGGIAWVSTSDDFGKTWSIAQPSNLPMPRAKAYVGKLSTGQLYLVHNFRNRDTLAISVGQPGEMTLNRILRLKHGRSAAPHFKGNAKSPQWSYPYAYEHDGNLFVVYSIGKEECGLTVVPVSSLSVE